MKKRKEKGEIYSLMYSNSPLKPRYKGKLTNKHQKGVLMPGGQGLLYLALTPFQAGGKWVAALRRQDKTYTLTLTLSFSLSLSLSLSVYPSF